MPPVPAEFANVTALTKANIYFDGKVVSHTIVAVSGEKKTLGLIYPGTYHFGTGAPERMEIVAGACKVTLDAAKGASASASASAPAVKTYKAGEHFDVPGKSGFTIEVAATAGICEYVCSYLA